MSANGWFQIGFFLLVIFLITKPLGVFLARVFSGQRTFLDPVLRPIEKLIYRLTGINEKHEMRWTEYAIAMLLFSGVSMAVLYLIERMQTWLPLNPQKFANVESGLAFGTAASFTTNTNWQAYSGESTMSYLTQMAGLAYHNFASAAVGIAVAIAVIRGIARKETDKQCRKWLYEPGRGRDRYQSRDASRYRAQHTRFAGADPFGQHPTKRSGGCAKMCGDKRAGGETRCRQRAARVETEPANPE